MEKRVCIKISEKDNVAVAIYDLQKGTEVLPGVVTAVDIPQAHKIAPISVTRLALKAGISYNIL